MRSYRLGSVLVVGVALALTACGSSSTGSGDTIASLTGTNFVVEPTVPSTTTTTLPPVAGAPIAGASTYTVLAGDLPYTIANKFKVGLNELITLNGWTLQGQFVTNFPPAGTEIKIPPGATVPGAETASTTATGSTQPGAASPSTVAGGATSSTLAGGGDNCAAGSYTITKNDNARVKVANKFNVTVEQLDAANANTAGYSSFAPGLKIVIPAKTTC